MTARVSFLTFVTLAIAGMAIAVLELRGADAAIFPLEKPSAAADSNLDPVEDAPVVRQVGSPAASARRPPPKEKARNGNPLWTVFLKQLSATRDRPIFSPSRRPPPMIAAPVAAAPKPAVVIYQPERPQLNLVGTIVGKDAAIGIFIERATRKAILLKLGQSHNGWTLISIAADAARLERFQQSVTITMREHDDQDRPRASSPPVPRPPQSGAAASPRRAAPVAASGNASQLFGQSPFTTTPVSERVNPFGSTPLFERTNR